jgi:Zinc knuckle
MAKITSRYHQPGRSYTAYYDDILQYCEQAGIPLDEGIIVHYLERGLTAEDIFRLRDKFGTPSLHQIKQQFEHWDSGHQLIKTIHPHPQSVQATSSKSLNSQRIAETRQQTTYKPFLEGGNFRRIPASPEQFNAGLGSNPQVNPEDRLARSLAQLLRRSQTSEPTNQQVQARNNPNPPQGRPTGAVNLIKQDQSMDLAEEEYDYPEVGAMANQSVEGEYEWTENSIAEVLAALQSSTGPNKTHQNPPTNTNGQHKSENPVMEQISSLTKAFDEMKDAFKFATMKQSNQKSQRPGTPPYSCWTCGNPDHFRSECPIFLQLFQTRGSATQEPNLSQSNKNGTNPSSMGNGMSPGQ